MRTLLACLLRCCPRDFREAYADEILELAERRRARASSRGRAFRVALHSALDILATAAAEWVDWLRRGTAVRPLESGRSSVFERVAFDLRDAARRLASAPGFAAAGLLMLAIGLGGSSVIFGAVDAFVLRDRPFVRVHELVFVYQDSDEGRPSSSAYPAYLDVKAHTSLFSAVGAVMPEGTATLLADSGEAQLVHVEFASSSYFPVLGLAPAAGRWFSGEEDHPGAPPAAVLTYHTWLRRFGGDAAVLGRTMRLSGATVTIVGIGPASFTGFLPGVASEAWLSISALGPVGGAFRGRTLTRREDHWFQIVARLAPGRTLPEAQAAMAALGERLGREFPETDRGRRITAIGGADVRVHPEIDPMLYSTAGAPLLLVALVLTLVCSNLANITLARGIARRREIALRLAIGASRAQVVRSLTFDSLLLSLAGAALGLLFARWVIGLLASWQAPIIEATPVLTVDWRVAGFALLLAVGTGLACGVVPALRATGGNLRDPLTAGAHGLRLRSLRGALVAIQVAVSIVLLVAGGVLVRSMTHALAIDPGFDARPLALVTVDAGQGGRPAAQAAQTILDVRDRIAALPDVEAVALTTRAPVTRFGPSTSLVLDELAAAGRDGTRSAELRFALVSADYFRTLRIPIVHGREFTTSDTPGSVPVAIVSRAMAVRFWGTTDVVGRRYRHEGSNAWISIAGVVGDVTVVAPGEAPAAFVYRPYLQLTTTQASLLIRTAGEPAAVLPAVRDALRTVDPGIPVLQASTMRVHVARSLALPRAAATVLACAAALALVLACLGVHAVVAFTVARRRTEMGVRMALGATARQVIGLVLREMTRLVGAGILLGTAAAAVATPVLRGLLIGVSPLDAITFVAVGLFVAGATLTATWIPARRAASADPAAVLRAE